MEARNETNRKETTRGFVKLDRRCFDYIDRSQPLSKFEALADLIQLTVNTTSLVVKTHGMRVNIPMGCVLLSERSCMKRWRWGSKRMTREFMSELRDTGIITPVQVIGNVGTVYAVGGTYRTTFGGNKLTDNQDIGQNSAPVMGEPAEPLHLLDKDNNIYKKENSSFFPKINSQAEAQYFRFQMWAQQSLPPHARPADRDMFVDMLREAGSPNIMADALIYMDAHDIPLSEYSTTLSLRPWTDARR